MKLKEMLENVDVDALFATPYEYGFPLPETYMDGMGKYAVWAPLGLGAISAVELRAIIAMLGRALVEIE